MLYVNRNCIQLLLACVQHVDGGLELFDPLLSLGQLIRRLRIAGLAGRLKQAVDLLDLRLVFLKIHFGEAVQIRDELVVLRGGGQICQLLPAVIGQFQERPKLFLLQFCFRQRFVRARVRWATCRRQQFFHRIHASLVLLDQIRVYTI